MWQIYGEKETCGTKGGLVSGWKQSMKSVSNNEWREVSRGHSTIMVANIMGSILSVRRTVARIIKLSGIYKWDSYQDIKDWYSTNGLRARSITIPSFPRWQMSLKRQPAPVSMRLYRRCRIMSRMNPKPHELARIVSEFLTEYAPLHLTNSEHTMHSYETALTLYIGYLEEKCGIKPSCFSAKCFEQQAIEGWLEWLSFERGCSPQSCNTRLSSFRKFIKYLSSRSPKYLYLLDEASKVPLRKKTKKKVRGLTRDAVKVLLAEPDTTRKTGIRDLTLMVVLYATAARIDEILSIKVTDLHLDAEKPYVVILGKGDKVRTLYLLPKAVEHIRLYMRVFHGAKPSDNTYLFFSRNKGVNEKLSQSAIRKMMKKYAVACHAKCEDVPLDLHAHQFRHAKASHWLEDGMNIAQISFLLGHSQLETTMIYLDITTDQEAAALATLEDESDRTAVPKWNPDTDSLSAICGLRKLR